MKTIRSNVNKNKKTLAFILFALTFFVFACCITMTYAYFSVSKTANAPSISFGKLLLSVDTENGLSSNRINLGVLTGNSVDGFELNNEDVLNGNSLSVIGSIGLETGSVDSYVRMKPEIAISNWSNSITALRKSQVTQLFVSRFMTQLLQLGDKNDSNACKWFAPTNADGYYYYGNAMTASSPFKYGDYSSHGTINLSQIITEDVREEMYGTSIALSFVFEAIQKSHIVTTNDAVIENAVTSGYSLANANIISTATYFVQDNFENLVFLDNVSNLVITEKIVEFGDTDFSLNVNVNSNQKTFTSSNTSVATINSTSGLVHIAGQGQTTISVSVTYGGETNSESITLTVAKRDLGLHKSDTIMNSINDEVYTGSQITPNIATFDMVEPIGTITLVKNQDYTLSYRDNINIGKATIIITGIGNYAGVIELTFKIRITYYVAFNSNGGTGTAMANQAFDYGETQTLTANTYTKSGYVFIGWNTASDGSGASYADEASVCDLTSVNGAVITLYAQWLGGLYTITLQSENSSENIYLWYGNGIYKDSSRTMPMTASTYAATLPIADTITITYNYNGGTGTLVSDTVPDGTFTGFYDTNTNLEMIDANGYVTNNFTNTTYSSNTTLVAEWGGTPSVTLPTPTLTGYIFGGWYVDNNTFNTKAGDGGDTYNVSDSMTLHAKWTPITYTIVFNANGGTGAQMQNQTFTYDISQNLASNSYTKTGYTFDSWNTLQTGLGVEYTNGQSISNITTTNNDEITLYAIWTPITYTIVFNANGGANTMQPQVLTYDVAATLTPNAFTNSGSTFMHWNRSQDGTGQSYVDEEEVINLATVQDAQITLYAIWGSTFTITLNSGGSIVNGTTTTGTTTLYEAYGQGLYLDQSLNNEITKSNASSLNAIVLPQKYYTVTYNLNDGQYLQPGISQKEFLGYYTLENGGSQIIDADGYVNTSVDYSFDEDKTLYAHWGDFEAITLPTAVRGGYVFKGWFTSQAFTLQVNSPYTPTADATLYANWKETFITFSSSSPFTIESLMGKSWGSHDWGTTSAANDPTNKDAGDGTIEYSTDLTNWTTWEKVDNQYVMSSGTGNVLYVRGLGNQVVTGYNKKDSQNRNLGWKLTGSNISCIGNIENLLDWETVAAGNHPAIDDMALRNLFANNPNLISAPELPLMSLTKECYASMFNGCTGLTNLPALPATTLGNSCYAWMFQNCTNILIVQAGSATPYTVVDTYNYASYSSVTTPCNEMFKGAVVLNSALVNTNGTPKLSGNNDCILEIAFIISTITLENNGATSGINAIYETNKESDGNGGYTDVNIKRYVDSLEQLTVIDDSIPAPEKSLTITYNYNGATGGNSTLTDTYEYTFLGYYTAQNGGGTQVIESDGTCKQAFMDERYLINTTMYAHWQAPNSLITLPNPTKTGYNFGGWYYDSALQNKAADGGDSFAPNVVMDLYAKWTPISYTIRFVGNNTHVQGAEYTQVFYYGQSQALTANQFTFNGHTFIMWTLNSTYETGDEYYEDEQVISTSLTTTDGDVITFYAQWLGGSSYIVTLNNNGATTAGTSNLYIDMDDNSLYLDMGHLTELGAGDSIVAPQKSYNVTLNLQGGTAIDGNGDEIVGFNNVQTINCQFEGYFNSNNEQMIDNLGKITNKLNTDRLNISDNVTFNAVWSSAPITLPNLEKENYLFKGWYANSTYTLKVGDAGDTYLPTGATTLYAKWRENYTQFTSDTSFTLSKSGGKKWDGTLYYSTSLASEDWTSNVWNGTGSVASAYDSSISKYVLYLKGVGNTYLSGFDYAANGNSWTSTNFQWSISSATNLILSGNFESMLDYNVVAGATSYTVGGNTYTVAGGDYELGHPIVGKGCAQYLFRQINVKEVSQDFLTSTIMGVDCYRDMFRGCSSLTVAPALPALTLASGCYAAMFRDCNKLATPPLLPAVNLATECYKQMFDKATGLQTIMTLTATNLVGTSSTDGCYASMFTNNAVTLYSSNSGSYNEFRIPYSGTATLSSDTILTSMFAGVTKPNVNTTYYVAKNILNTVTFNKDGGTGGSDYVGAINGNAMPVAEAPIKAGYIFDGYWSKSGGNFVKQYYDENMESENNWDMVTNETLYAKWIANEYQVIFHINDGDTELVKYQTGLNYNSTIPTNVFTRDGYTFAGWSLTSNGTALAGTPAISDANPTASTIVLYAKWTAN